MKNALLALLLLLAALPVRAASGDGAAPRVLLVAPAIDERARGFAELLEESGVPVVTATWGEATKERARGFDLVVVTGPGRTVDAAQAVLDYDRPVLGVGGYGGAYFAHLRLKHGAQHT